MGETETPHFYDFGTFERALSSQQRLFFLWRAWTPKTKQENHGASQNILFVQISKFWKPTISKLWTSKMLAMFKKACAEQI